MKSKTLTILISSFLIFANPYIAKASTVTNYSVKSGDCLWKIAQNFNTSISKIASLNNINPNDYIYIGQNLKVEDNRYIYHTVISGDSLWKLSVKYNTSIESIMKLNNISNSNIYIGQVLKIQTSSSNNVSQKVETTNYKVVSGDTLWSISKKFNTSMDAIQKSNMLALPILMPGQIITVPVNSTKIVKPVGITLLKKRASESFGDLYTWKNARRLFTVGQTGTLKDLNTGISFNIKYYGGSNHADIVPLTTSDSSKMKQIYGSWSWSYMRPMILTFVQENTYYKIAVSVTGMPHSTTDMYDKNGINGHFDMYFYNSTSHNTNELSPTHQKNILIANGQ